MKRILGGTGAAIAAKVLSGIAVVAFAAAGAGAATEVAVTGSLNPNDWGQQVKATVATCKTTLRASGVRGIGPCVSAFAKQHGDLVSDSHQASNARDGHSNNGKDKGKGKGSNGSDSDQAGDKGHGKPSTVPSHS